MRISSWAATTAAVAILGSAQASAGAQTCAGKAAAEAELIALEHQLESTISREFAANPVSVIKYFDTQRIRLFDIMPTDKHGGLEVSTEHFEAHLKKAGPDFAGTVEFLSLQAFACGDVGFVSM